ncbi:unnamed protein product [Lasius platythorax]|uniref:Uncharacterized protein n=1 Tax=Lasius platythorax TaxID=488582 RepID=A0AAV2NJU6_9HYME
MGELPIDIYCWNNLMKIVIRTMNIRIEIDRSRATFESNLSTVRDLTGREETVDHLPVRVHAPLMRALVRTLLATELRFRVHALELPVPPEGPLRRVALAAIRAYVGLLARLTDDVSLLLV